MAAPERQHSVEPPDRESPARTGPSEPEDRESPARKRPSEPGVRRRARLVRGPLTIGEPAPRVDLRLATADPYRPDTIADGGDAHGLMVRAASVRGLYKRYVGGSRQDDLCLRVHAPTRTLIVAVADGVSAAARSDLGAALAVRHAVSAVARQLDDGAAEIDWRKVFDHAAWALVEEHRRERADPRASIDEVAAALATTLVVATIARAAERDSSDRTQGEARGENESAILRLQAAAVGDSPALVLSEGRFEPLVGETEPTDGWVGGGVRALPRHTRPVCAEARTLAPGAVLLVCTDGLALPLADGTGEVGSTLARELSRPPDIVDFARLLDFSRSTYDDDRTLVAVWPRCER